MSSISTDSGFRDPQVAQFRQAVVEKLAADKDKLTARSQELLWKVVQAFVDLEKRIASYQEKLETIATTHPECQRLMTIPGIGAITATALVAAVGAVGIFKNGRQLANPARSIYCCDTKSQG